jgi:hypothetical protein
MPLDPISAQKVTDWTKAKGMDHCPICRGAAWGMGLLGLPKVPAPLSPAHQLNIAGAGLAIHVALTCESCGYTLLLRAAKLGIVAPHGS